MLMEKIDRQCGAKTRGSEVVAVCVEEVGRFAPDLVPGAGAGGGCSKRCSRFVRLAVDRGPRRRLRRGGHRSLPWGAACVEGCVNGSVEVLVVVVLAREVGMVLDKLLVG